MRIDEIDKALKVESAADLADGVYLDVRNDPFDVYGLYDYKNQPRFCRMPEEVAQETWKLTTTGITDLMWHTAGGRVRFTTDSPYVAIRCKMKAITFMPHMPLDGMCGFDLYETVDGRDRYIDTYRVPFTRSDSEIGVISICPDHGFSSNVWVGETGKMRSYTIHFPLYNDVEKLEIGLRRDASVDHGAPYEDVAPVVFYGSSITQGGCASHPGNAYENLFSAYRNIDHINLGFSGSACGEKPVAEYIASLNMSLFVMDYDYNAVNPWYLEQTHKPFYDIIRAAHPDLPIIMISRCTGPDREDNLLRREVIYRSYKAAVEAGDPNVYFLDGDTFFAGKYRSVYTVDGVHPNDAGFYKMAEIIGNLIDDIRADKAK